MNYETNRLNTFTNWPSSAPVDPVRIAKAGFFFTGEGSEVQCFSCGGKISQWYHGDQVMWRHRQLDPNCAFVVNPQLSGNVPLVLGPECPSINRSYSQSLSERSNESTSNDGYGHTEEDEMYKSDALRLLSFINWNDTSISRENLVSAGFYHAGEGKLRCAWCGGELASLGASFVSRFGPLTPLEVHRMYFPRCEHAVSLEASQQSARLSPPISLPSPSDTPPLLTPPRSSEQPQSSGAVHNENVLNMGGTWRALGVVSGGARVPQYSSLAARLASFNRWPADRQQDPRALAEAGFFHTGTDDQVRCFYCDGGLGKWEAGDTPWSEHAHWFPHCGYVLLVKGQEFVDTCTNKSSVERTITPESVAARRIDPAISYALTENLIEECMDSPITLAALSAGLDAARVRRAITRRVRLTGMPFTTSEGLIDAVLDEQLNEEAWSVTPQSQRLARDILAETLREFAPRSGIIPSSQWDDRPDSANTQLESPTRSISPECPLPRQPSPLNVNIPMSSTASSLSNVPSVSETKIEKRETNMGESEKEKPLEKTLTLEEENRQLKEARTCKVCMDSEVSVVFLPCGHLVSCGGCGAALSTCPLCRSTVRALVRAYLA